MCSAAVVAAAAIVIAAAVAAAISAIVAVKTTAAEQKNQNNNDPKTVVAISAEHKRNLSPHGGYRLAVSIVRGWKLRIICLRSDGALLHPQYTMPIEPYG